jgi:myo-inositol-1(or 4)-monophosphatase
LDLAYVASGRFDGFWEFGLNEWDIAAGVLLIQEAGGLISDMHGNNTHMSTGNVLAANPKVFKEMLKRLHPVMQKY